MRIFSQHHIETQNTDPRPLISITGHGKPWASVFGYGPVLRLCFDDVPMPAWRDHTGVLWQGPRLQDLTEALAFCQIFQTLEIDVHCLHGKSRSAGIAMVVLTDHFQDASKALEHLMPHLDLERFFPNPGLISMGDQLLGSNIDQVLSVLPRYVSWKAYWSKRGWTP